MVAPETVEHDFNRRMRSRPPPRFEDDATYLDALRIPGTLNGLPFEVRVGVVASGDEGIDSPARARELVESIGAIALAWEGAGGARACHFSGVPYL